MVSTPYGILTDPELQVIKGYFIDFIIIFIVVVIVIVIVIFCGNSNTNLFISENFHKIFPVF